MVTLLTAGWNPMFRLISGPAHHHPRIWKYLSQLSIIDYSFMSLKVIITAINTSLNVTRGDSVVHKQTFVFALRIYMQMFGVDLIGFHQCHWVLQGCVADIAKRRMLILYCHANVCVSNAWMNTMEMACVHDNLNKANFSIRIKVNWVEWLETNVPVVKFSHDIQALVNSWTMLSWTFNGGSVLHIVMSW